MPAWKHRSTWDEKAIAAYRSYAFDRCLQLYDDQDELDCADFCLQILIEYASTNGLSIVIKARIGDPAKDNAFYSVDDRWSSQNDFLSSVLHGTETNEVVDGHGSAYGNTVPIAVNDLDCGDMLAHLSEAPVGKRANTWGHLQLVRRSSLQSKTFSGVPEKSGTAEIYQGNLTYTLFWSAPTTIQRGEYYFRDKKFYYRREGDVEKDGVTLWSEKDVTPVRWNFEQFDLLNWSYVHGSDAGYLV